MNPETKAPAPYVVRGGELRMHRYHPLSELGYAEAPGGGFLADVVMGMVRTQAPREFDFHIEHDEMLFIHRGSMELRIGDEVHRLGPGDMVALPAGTDVTYVYTEETEIVFACAPDEARAERLALTRDGG